MIKKFLRGYNISFEENSLKGFEHLAYVLSFEEAEALFKSAYLSGKTYFEDRVGRNYTLISQNRFSFELKKR
ncbi:MAG: hypothetical protein PHW15_03245 [Patescibacteria group bacterium]|jgi:hypothetical protein|nr:hypothetical protein [Patescibacteria group bacterium]